MVRLTANPKAIVLATAVLSFAQRKICVKEEA